MNLPLLTRIEPPASTVVLGPGARGGMRLTRASGEAGAGGPTEADTPGLGAATGLGEARLAPPLAVAAGVGATVVTNLSATRPVPRARGPIDAE